ncbi:MAG: hypothetical protein Q9163_001722 [Psora crenata]
MSAEFKDKTVLLVDDSIVRGNTSLEICLMAREAGAKIDLAISDELIAYSKTPAEVAIAIGADMVIYQTLSDLVAACAELSPRGRDCNFESGVFSGCYVTGVPDGYFEHLERVRGGNKRSKIPEAARKRYKIPEPAGHTVDGTIVDEDLSQAVARVKLEMVHSSVTPTSQDISLHNFND